MIIFQSFLNYLSSNGETDIINQCSLDFMQRNTILFWFLLKNLFPGADNDELKNVRLLQNLKTTKKTHNAYISMRSG